MSKVRQIPQSYQARLVKEIAEKIATNRHNVNVNHGGGVTVISPTRTEVGVFTISDKGRMYEAVCPREPGHHVLIDRRCKSTMNGEFSVSRRVLNSIRLSLSLFDLVHGNPLTLIREFVLRPIGLAELAYASPPKAIVPVD